MAKVDKQPRGTTRPKSTLEPKPDRHRMKYLDVQVVFVRYLTYTTILDAKSWDAGTPVTLGTLNWQASESDVKAWIHGWIGGKGTGFEEGIETLRRNLLECLGLLK